MTARRRWVGGTLPAGCGSDRRLHVARPATHLCLPADDARCVFSFSRRAARSHLDEDDDALRAPVAGVSVSRSKPARSTEATVARRAAVARKDGAPVTPASAVEQASLAAEKREKAKRARKGAKRKF